MLNILIVYCSYDYPLRTSVLDHLYSFQRYSSHNCFYLNIFLRKFPGYLRSIKFDLIIFHTIFLAMRWNPKLFQRLVRKAHALKDIDAVKIILPQDEFLNTDVLCDFINEFGVEHVFSAAPKSEWSKIYHKVNFRKVKFHQVLTGYLDDSTISRINALASGKRLRLIEIGYRAWKAQPWLGRHGMLKTYLAERFQDEAHKKGLSTDISLREKDMFVGDSWYEFLLNCKYTPGVEGGASILDYNGSIRDKTTDYIKRNPEASFDEVENNCFPGLEGSLSLFVISPRHLEACATRTCQILVEGTYSGILQPGLHYIELKSDFSNLEQVLKLVKQDSLRAEITERAYNDIVKSDRYTYRRFVNFVLEMSLLNTTQDQSNISRKPKKSTTYRITKFADSLSWAIVAVIIRPLLIFRRYLLILIKLRT